MAKTYPDNVPGIKVDMGEDITEATTRHFKVLKPDGTEATWPAEGEADILDDQYLVYTIEEGDLDQAGEYLIHPYLTGGGFPGLCDLVRLVVTPEWS
jgi:hypothetical protein